jgi:hypothetical protein
MENKNNKDYNDYDIEKLKTRKRILSQKFKIDHRIK